MATVGPSRTVLTSTNGRTTQRFDELQRDQDGEHDEPGLPAVQSERQEQRRYATNQHADEREQREEPDGDAQAA